jgi:cytosine/adenosine deaminase-related metal-dependent hydrolase
MRVEIAPSKDFAQLLDHLWWRLDRAIDPEILRASACAGCSDALKAGVTSIVDHHAGPECIDGSLSVLREGFEMVGTRGILCYETTDRNGAFGAREGVAENLRFAKEVDAMRAEGKKPLVEAAIGAHASFTISDETLEALARAMHESGRGIHIISPKINSTRSMRDIATKRILLNAPTLPVLSTRKVSSGMVSGLPHPRWKS